MRVIYLKATKNGHRMRYVGTVAEVTERKGEELLKEGIVEKYAGPWPRTRENKRRINLKDLKTWQLQQEK